MRKDVITMLDFDIDVRSRILVALEQDNDWRKIPIEVKDMIYKLYDFLQVKSYEMIDVVNSPKDDITVGLMLSDYMRKYQLEFEDTLYGMLYSYDIDLVRIADENN